MEAEAATGSIEIQLQETLVDKIIYSKVATMLNGTWELEDDYKGSKVNLNTIENAKELETAAESLLIYMKDKKEISTEGNKIVLLQELEEGMYLIASAESSEMEMLPTLVSVPDLTGEERVYDVILIPKCDKKIVAPATGWDSQENIYTGLIFISLVIIVGLSCHNRFKCGKIPFNYLKK